MKFKNNNHQALFNNEAKRMNRHDNVKMAVLYLLTADFKLWNEAKRHIKRGNIDLDNIKVKNGNLKAYTLLSVARDIACGTSYLSIHDLSDTDIISDIAVPIMMKDLKEIHFDNGNLLYPAYTETEADE